MFPSHDQSGPTKRTAGDLEISAEQAKQVWEKYIEKYGINNEVELDYFDRFETNRKKKDGSTISSTSPFLRIGLRMENELDPNSKIVAVSSEDTHINFVKNAANYLNDKKGKNLTFEPLKADKIEVEPGVKFSATEMRRAISENDFEAFKAFMPEKLSDDDVKSMFNLLGGSLEEINESVIFIMETIEKALDIILLTEKVRKTKGKEEYCVVSKNKKTKKGKLKTYGCYTSKKAANKRLGQIEGFKAISESEDDEEYQIVEMSSMSGGSVQGYAGGNKNKFSLIREEE